MIRLLQWAVNTHTSILYAFILLTQIVTKWGNLFKHPDAVLHIHTHTHVCISSNISVFSKCWRCYLNYVTLLFYSLNLWKNWVTCHNNQIRRCISIFTHTYTNLKSNRSYFKTLTFLWKLLKFFFIHRA